MSDSWSPSKPAMKHLPSITAVFALLVLNACTTTVTKAPDPAGSTPQAGNEEGAQTDPGKTPGSSGEPAKPEAPKGIGSWEDKGLAVVQGDTNTPKTCKELCTSKGGTCVQALEPGQGGSSSIAGVATYLFIQPGKPAVFLPYDLPTCTSPVPATQEAINDTGSLYKYECSCDAVAVPPRATVTADEGVHTCKDVCTSWGKACTNSRKWEDGTEGGALAFYGTGTSAVTKAFNCSTKPEAKLEKSALEGYSCACE